MSLPTIPPVPPTGAEPTPSVFGVGRVVALIAGPVAAIVVPSLGIAGIEGPPALVLGAMAWMAIWWISECLPLAVTALLPIALFPLLGIATLREAAAPFANDIIYLYLGGFLLAAALEYWGAHERIALAVIDRVGLSSRRLVLGVMLATAFISMWISNTATAAMMYPIALAIGTLFGEGAAARSQRVALLLGVAFAASLGGMATLIGTPPNLILAGATKELIGVTLDFTSFLRFGLPIALLTIPAAWALLVFVFHREQLSLGAAGRELLTERRVRLGRLGGGERNVLIVFVLTALAWFFREPKLIGSLAIPGLTQLLPGLTDAGIAVIIGMTLFIVPGRRRTGSVRPLLTWEEARAIPWDVLLLFGGGLSLANAMDASGLATIVGGWMSGLREYPLPVVMLGIAMMTVLISEFASNAATASMGMPIAVSLAAALEQPPLLLMILVGLSASIGFALPMATPPNAIVFGSGELRVRDMIRAGLALDLVAVLVVVGVLLVVF